MRIKGQVLKILACNTALVAVLQHSWLRHSCCNTATCAVLHARIFNTWPLILKYLPITQHLLSDHMNNMLFYDYVLCAKRCFHFIQCHQGRIFLFKKLYHFSCLSFVATDLKHHNIKGNLHDWQIFLVKIFAKKI